jgi:hypothetical protein
MKAQIAGSVEGSRARDAGDAGIMPSAAGGSRLADRAFGFGWASPGLPRGMVSNWHFVT